MSKSWDSNILKKLKGLMGKGLSTAEIGKKLGISKNAVVGKLHRMGWNSGANESAGADTKKVATKKTAAKKVVANKGAPVKKTSGAAAKVARPAPKPKDVKKTAPAKTQIKVADGGAKKTAGRPMLSRGTNVHQRIVQHALEMANLKPNQCRWPIGDPDSNDFHFCGQTVFVGKPYCYEHCKQAYQFTPPKKK